VWAARADFAKDHPEVIKGLVAGIFDGMDRLKDATQREKAYQWMAEGYGMQADEVRAMAQDAHSTNFSENKAFFLNANDPANFERTWKNVTFVYRELGLLDTPTRFDEVMDFSVLQELDKAGTFAHQKDESRATFAPTSYKKMSPSRRSSPRPSASTSTQLGQRLRAAARRGGKPIANTALRPERRRHPREGGRLVGQYERAVVAVVGHTDSSMKGKGTRFEDVKALSTDRAEAVKQALVKK